MLEDFFTPIYISITHTRFEHPIFQSESVPLKKRFRVTKWLSTVYGIRVKNFEKKTRKSLDGVKRVLLLHPQ